MPKGDVTWVLAAGVTQTMTPGATTRAVSEALGRALAERGFGIIVFGLSVADRELVAAYLAVGRSLPRPKQVLVRGMEEWELEGVELSVHRDDTWTDGVYRRALAACEAVIAWGEYDRAPDGTAMRLWELARDGGQAFIPLDEMPGVQRGLVEEIVAELPSRRYGDLAEADIAALIPTEYPVVTTFGSTCDSVRPAALVAMVPTALDLAARIARATRRRSRKAVILMLCAAPQSMPRLALDEEQRFIEERIRESEFRDSIALESEWAVRPDDLIRALNEHRPEIVHFSGHGTSESEIVLVDEGGDAKAVGPAALARLFTAMKDDIRLVVLDACETDEAATALATVIDCVVGMSREIGDQDARTFSGTFYRAIGYGRSVAEAFAQGTAALALTDGVGAPTLAVREGVDAGRVHFVGDH